MIRRALVVLVVVLVAGAAAWWLLRDGDAAGGSVTIEWRGSRIGRATLPARIAWCPITRLATLEAVSNDTGLVITLLEQDSLSNGPHQAVVPEIRDRSPVPNAVAALRWVLSTDTLVGYRSSSGVVDVSTAAGVASGRIDLRMRSPVGMDTLVVRGEFRAVPVVASAVGCP